MHSDVPPPVRPESRSGCLTALYIALGVGVLLVLVAGAGVWLFLRSEQGQRLVTVAREGMTMAQEAMTAPGTDALRSAGCRQPMVMSSARLTELARVLGPEGPAENISALGVETLVVCQSIREEGSAPGCSEIARTYAAAVPDAPARFAVTVTHARGGTACQGVYTPDGTLIEPVE